MKTPRAKQAMRSAASHRLVAVRCHQKIRGVLTHKPTLADAAEDVTWLTARPSLRAFARG
jgi:hypothetical protein